MSRHHRRRSRDLRASDVVERAIDLALNHAGGVVFTLRVSHEDDRGHRARVESCRTRTPTVTFFLLVKRRRARLDDARGLDRSRDRRRARDVRGVETPSEGGWVRGFTSDWSVKSVRSRDAGARPPRRGALDVE